MYMYTIKYTVEMGDTLYSIAKKFNLKTYKQLLPVNRDISNPNNIRPGQVINVPKSIPMITYLVKPGDTLGTILYNYNLDHINLYGMPITMDELLAYNPTIVDPNLIYAGMILYLPEFL